MAGLLPITVIAAAAGDIVLSLPRLPRSGADQEAKEIDRQIGGSGFNVARALVRLQIPVINGIPVGNGCWGEQITKEMQDLGLEVTLTNPYLDNGWCLAMVEPDGERSFVSVSGCEVDWSTAMLSSIVLPERGYIYSSGYVMASKSTAILCDWLLASPSGQTLLLDFGPRLPEIDPTFLDALPADRTILTLNRDEVAILCGEGDPAVQASRYSSERKITIICRLGSLGTWICLPDRKPEYVAAYKVKVVDTIGAGDAHSGGMLAGLSQGMSLRDAVELGNRVAAIVVNRSGAAGAPTIKELEEFVFE
ncbi:MULTISPECIES: carbohydrate kinase family protein [Photorhabdus]|uniref:carbohydrate kinase family protein n=1 Tax=Photorhabdus TaxID=29487 RepID=UPI000D6347D3|nr:MULTISPECIES: carbohydrate kinase family protein [Photorhabdus]AWK44368.1 ribokinase [Photorhabdus laumondii subsp. laumondii]AXG45094.1 ribokinase [Photorhabdus laumondii subsp. laumondii]MCC8388220.1 ribokinase [Photorhabdus laumondii]MCZ1248218.1 ribokinase [Photorhabdus laumondii subsp. laumondii]NDL15846.1 ribokinase [Photorhabdus laumondii subsp. laumondii]